MAKRNLTLQLEEDALIVEAALRSGAARLATEDLQTGRLIGGMRIVNPFA